MAKSNSRTPTTMPGEGSVSDAVVSYDLTVRVAGAKATVAADVATIETALQGVGTVRAFEWKKA